jgi:SH3-like domain-containing protein
MKKFTDTQMAILTHRLTLTDCITEVLAISETDETLPEDQYNSRRDAAAYRIGPKADAVVDHVYKYRCLPEVMDDDVKNIVEDAVAGSTWFANEFCDGENTPLWWANQRRAADVVARIVSAAIGREVRFP